MARVLLKTIDLSSEPFVEGLMYGTLLATHPVPPSMPSELCCARRARAMMLCAYHYADIINGQTAQVTGMRNRLGQRGDKLPEDVACNNLQAIYAAAAMQVPYSIGR